MLEEEKYRKVTDQNKLIRKGLTRTVTGLLTNLKNQPNTTTEADFKFLQEFNAINLLQLNKYLHVKRKEIKN